MKTPIIPAEVLQKTDKIVFVAHLALGDFTYLQAFFKAFAVAYPHIKIHIWVDELRKTRCFWRWKHLKAYALYDWLEACPFIDKVYKKTYAPHLLKQEIKSARAENYPLVVSLATLRPFQYARLARTISPNGFVVGVRSRASWWQLGRRYAYSKLDASFDPKHLHVKGKHISGIYAEWFTTLFGLEVSEADRFPVLNTPHIWTVYAKLRFLKWGINKGSRPFGKVIFINAFAKDKKRCWSLERVAELIMALKHHSAWEDTSFIINIVPEAMHSAQKYFDKQSLNNTILVSAQHNFFQLPAIMAECDLIISVETAVMHLANAVHVPVVALMRQKNPEWAPIDAQNSTIITTKNRVDWVQTITVDHVIKTLENITI